MNAAFDPVSDEVEFRLGRLVFVEGSWETNGYRVPWGDRVRAAFDHQAIVHWDVDGERKRFFFKQEREGESMPGMFEKFINHQDHEEVECLGNNLYQVHDRHEWCHDEWYFGDEWRKD